MFPIATSYSVLALAVSAAARGGIPPPPVSAPVPVNIDSIYSEFYKLPEAFRFFVSGNFGNVVFYTLERILYGRICKLTNLPILIEEHKHAVSFFLAYLVQVATQHWLNAFFVYGLDSISTKEKYLRTLRGCYRVYAISLIGTTAMSTSLVKFGVDRTISFFLTLGCFACINYFILKMLVEESETSPTEVDATLVNKIQRGGGGCGGTWNNQCTALLRECVMCSAEPLEVE